MKEIYREALRAGSLVETFLTFPELVEIFYKEASDEQLAYIPETRRLLASEYETMISLCGETKVIGRQRIGHSLGYGL